VRERSARPKGDGGAIPVRLSAVRTSVVLLQSRIYTFTRAPYIGTSRYDRPTPRTDPGCELRNQGWARVEAQKCGTKRCGRVFRPWRAVSLYSQRKWCLNWSAALLLAWEIAWPSEARDVRESFLLHMIFRNQRGNTGWIRLKHHLSSGQKIESKDRKTQFAMRRDLKTGNSQLFSLIFYVNFSLSFTKYDFIAPGSVTKYFYE